MTCAEHHHCAGISLVEMVVSLFLVGLIGLAGLVFVDSLTTTQLRIDHRYVDLSELESALRDLELDISQADPRDILLAAGTMSFTSRACGGEAQITLAFSEDGLTRSASPCLPRTAILGAVEEGGFRLITEDGTAWPVWPLGDEGDTQLRPVAVEIRLVLPERDSRLSGVVRKLVELPAGPMS